MTDYEKIIDVLGRWESTTQTYSVREAQVHDTEGACIVLHQGEQSVALFFDAEGKIST